ncbi:MAG: hypothetical protein KJ007_15725 [Burkholderiales bacterium]|nr:hypothetical protein [Burkholderiales bacterium]
MAEPIHVNIDFANIRETARKGVRRTAVFLGLGINAALDPALRKYELSDISPIHLVPSNVPEETIAHFKTEFGRWVVANGLRELIETFALFLDRTHNACLFMASHKGKISFEDATQWQPAFHHKGIEDKLKVFQNRFGVKPNHPEHLSTIQQVRNCFTHRHGIVGKQDCDDGDELTLKWMGFDIFIETPTGETIDLTLPLKEEIHLKDGGTVCLRFSERVRKYKLNTPVNLEPQDLVEICNFILMSTDQLLASVSEFAKNLGIPDAEQIAQAQGSNNAPKGDGGDAARPAAP